MLFKITRAEGEETTEETRPAENRQEIEQQMADENPGFSWTSSDSEDYLIGRKPGSIIIIKPE